MENKMHPLKPDETIHKILISTTSRILGEYESESILIAHAWQNSANSSGSIRMEENPVSRSAFIVAFQTEPYEKAAGVVVPDYSPVGEIVCSYLSVLYGKRFDCHGLVEGSGLYNAPDLSAYNSICNPKLPFNSHQERHCFKIPLNLTHFSVLEKIFTSSSIDSKFISKLQAACKFYLQALQSAESEPEVAYLHLITAGEILSGHYKYRKEEILDGKILDSLKLIEDGLENGSRISRQISSKLLSIKRRFVKSLCSLIDEEFFETKETCQELCMFVAEDIEQRVGAAYDLRSKYVHTGVPFGRWVKPQRLLSDVQHGKPVVNNKEFAKILARAPTFIGLERLIRYCLLRFMVQNGFQEIETIRKVA